MTNKNIIVIKKKTSNLIKVVNKIEAKCFS